MNSDKYRILPGINSPKDLKPLSLTDLKILCSEIRDYMVEVVSKTGGHFGGGLGAVELAVALHRVFNAPEDKIIWDVGHQAYPHKILTGRKDKMPSLRQFGGLSGFLKRTESPYDAFGAGHASTSISAALGMAVARDLKGEKNRVIAVIGDGAMTGGMAYEALNNTGVLKKDLIVVLNDNHMSISKNVWQLSNYFTDVIAHPDYNRFKGIIWNLTGKLQFGDRLRDAASRLNLGIKTVLTPGMLFEALGFRYFGPINGNKVGQLVNLLEKTKNLGGPILIHCITEKGKGYKPAEGDSEKWHAAVPFDISTGRAKKKSSTFSYTKVFGTTLLKLMRTDQSIVAITAAMADGTGLVEIEKEYPGRFFDVGIAEEHAVTFAAGLATQGIRPVVAIYSTFLQRAIDQIIHDVALQRLPVVFCLDRAGLVGADGPTHHGSFDLSYLSLIPNMIVMAPSNEKELQNMMFTAIDYDQGPVAIRYPRGAAPGDDLLEDYEKIPIGRAKILSEGKDAVIFAIGSMVEPSVEAAQMLKEEGIGPAVVDMRFVKPLDEGLVLDLASRYGTIITVEENSIKGGFGSAVACCLEEHGLHNRLINLGIPDEFVEHGTQAELYEMLGLNAPAIASTIRGALNR